MLRGIQWCNHVIMTFPKLVQFINWIYCTCFLHVGPVDYNRFDSLLNCCTDLKDIIMCLIPWDNHYTQACPTPVTTIRNEHSSEFYISLQWFVQALSRIIQNYNKLKELKSIVLLKCHHMLSGCGVSRRRCTTHWILLIEAIWVFPTLKRG